MSGVRLARTLLAAAVGAAALLGALPGCNILGPATYLVTGPPKKAAEIELPKVKTVVFVDDRQNQIRTNSRQLRNAVGERITSTLLEKDVLESMIQSADAMALATSSDRFGDLLSIEELGKRLGAEQVIFVEMRYFRETPDGATPNPTAAAAVKVLDITGKRKIYPLGDDPKAERMVTASLGEIDPVKLQGDANRVTVFRRLAEALGTEVAKLFFEHEVNELGPDRPVED